MDDCCAVCAEPLEWVAYGPCLHREVCSTCVSRLRFICDDRRCCICKADCNVVFVTKALGDYTRMISDFSSLPSDIREGRAGSYWYHEDTNAFFDDVDQYKMIKAMCRLSCSVCDKMEEQPYDASKRRARFRNIEQLKGHLFHHHKLFMCSLCLEGRKVFICEQKLYNRAQLNQHIRTADFEVDGSENERGGFMGHPMCEFCRTPFYGDNELYLHMSTEHYTCHICQRQHPGQYEYYKNYDDLEIHFRQEHFLCEDEACLAKKFVVFQSEAEMKRHNAMEHGGRMSRSKRNAALQIPTSFRYRHGNEQDQRLGRGHTFRLDFSGSQLSMAIEASLETANAEQTFHDSSTSTCGQVAEDHGSTDFDSIVQSFESISTGSAPSLLYLQALGQNSRNAPLEESSFPPLAVASSNDQQRSRHELQGSSSNTMAAHLRHCRNKTVSVIKSGQAWPAAIRGPAQSSNNTAQSRLSTNNASAVSSNSGQSNVIKSGQAWPAGVRGPAQSSNNIAQSRLSTNNAGQTDVIKSGQAWPVAVRGPAQSRLSTNNASAVSSNSGQMKTVNSSEPLSSTYASSIQAASRIAHGQLSAGSLRDSCDNGRIVHSASAPTLVESSHVEAAVSDFPPISASQVSKLRASSQSLLKVESVHSANKSMVDKIRGALDFDQDRYTIFKDISAQYRQGTIDTGAYLDYVRQFGLSHLVLELARLCPDAQKQKELVESYNASLQRKALQENGWVHGNTHLKDRNASKKGKGKSVDTGEGNSTERLADSFLNTVRQLRSSNKPSEENLQVLSRGDYRTSKSKSKVEPHIDTNSGSRPMVKLGGQSETSTGSLSNQNREEGVGGSKQRKKTSKFLRVRLGEGSASAGLNSHSEFDPGTTDSSEGYKNDSGGLPVRGVWRNGGGHKLVP